MKSVLFSLGVFIILAVAFGCRRSDDVMLSAPTEPPEPILKPALLPQLAPPPPAVEKPISLSTDENKPTVTLAENTAPKAPAPQDALVPASASLNVGKGAAKDSRNFLHHCQEGDTTESIAAAYAIDEKTLCALNGVRQGANFSRGKVLLLRADVSNISEAPDVTTYTVTQGDTFSKIARLFNISSTALMKMNATENSSLQIGDPLYVPKK